MLKHPQIRLVSNPQMSFIHSYDKLGKLLYRWITKFIVVICE